MIHLTQDQRAYKEKTLRQLQANLPHLESQLEQESRADVIKSLQKQVDDTRSHLELLQHELAANTAGEPVADDLYRRAAAALTNKKFFLAKKLLTRLETIEPFYPGVDILLQEAEAGRASRRTQAIAQRGVPPGSPSTISGSVAATPPINGEDAPVLADTDEPERRGLARFFQFHIILSCLVVLLILCVMAGVGGIMLLEWLVEGG